MVPPSPTKRIPVGRLLVGVVAIIALMGLGRQLGGYLPEFAEWVDGLGWWGPLIFMAGYVAATVAFVPGSVLTLAAGAIFGLASGLVYVFIAATVGSAAAFLISRHIARSVIEDRIQNNERFAAIDRAIGRKGLKIVILLRLSPMFPFNLLNYALGLTSVSFTAYVFASPAMLPGTLLYVYYGKIASDVALLAGGASMHGPTYYAVLGLGLAAMIAVTTLVTRTARQALREATGD